MVLTYQCNLDCPYCQLHNLRYISDLLTSQEWSSLIENLSEVLNRSTPFFISGGEPTLNFKLLSHILTSLSKHDRISILISNATLLNMSKINILGENGLYGLLATFHFYYMTNHVMIEKRFRNTLSLLSYYKKLTSGISAISVNINTKKDFIIFDIIDKLGKEGYFKNIDLLEIAILKENLDRDPLLNSPILHLEDYTDVQIIHYGREGNDITEIVITPDGFVIPFETVYPKLLKDPSRVKYFYNVRKDDIRKALNKEYLDTIKRIAMKWED